MHAEVDPGQPTDKAAQRAPSSCLPGSKLSGLSYAKNKPEIYALEDSEYPDWLWGLLEEFEEKEKADKGGVDPSSMCCVCSVPFLGSFKKGLCGWALLTVFSYEQKTTKAS